MLDWMKMDLLDVKQGVICHQVNCKGVMGAGIALQIRQKWQKVWQVYHSDCVSGHAELGNITVVKVDDGLWVANLFAQENYRPSGRRHTDYNAFRECLKKLSKWRHVEMEGQAGSLGFYFPKGIGCGLAGGDWKVVEQIIAQVLPTATLCVKDN